jgi:hypothetical protein
VTSNEEGGCREFGLVLKQMLYFDRYVQALAPELQVFKDSRVALSDAPRAATTVTANGVKTPHATIDVRS